MTEAIDRSDRESWDELVRAGEVPTPATSVVQAALHAVREAAAREQPAVGAARQRRWQPTRWVALAAAVAAVGVVAAVTWSIMDSSTADDPGGPLVEAPGNTVEPETATPDGSGGEASPTVTGEVTPDDGAIVQGTGRSEAARGWAARSNTTPRRSPTGASPSTGWSPLSGRLGAPASRSRTPS